ncbi:MAG: asparagine synthase (glutamine-hydrolyzing), partial [Planctomycetes bacterium]|nr:asparagine synthase (glutamine-hydrolyzing) [Planctomycetota bacterium]
GPDCVRDLQGMFAFAIWDEEKRTLFAARDRLGKKPFVYWAGDGRFVFASEIAALLEHPAVPRRLDREALAHYLAWLVVPAPLTMLDGVRKLPPGHALTWDGRLSVRRYWEPRVEIGEAEDYEERIVAALTDAVRRRLVADVPVGAFLSGGIDSTIVAGLMPRGSRTFSIGFEEEKFSELPYAREAARAFGSAHHEEVVRADSAAVLPELIERYGEPFGDSSAIPTYFVSKATARHVKVALSGDGGDECFAGYLRYEAMAHLARLRRVPEALLRFVSRLVPRATGRGERIGRLLGASKRPIEDLYIDLVTVFPREMRAELGARGEVRARVAEPFLRAGADPVTAASFADLVTYLPDDLLVKVDIASMANGLEVRCPFLDPEVVDLAFRIPARLKRRKSVLKRAFRDLLPPAIRRRAKMGFAVPLAEWLRGPLRGLLEDALLGKTARERGIFPPAVVERLVREHLSGARDHRDRLWLLLVFELWARRFLGGGVIGG